MMAQTARLISSYEGCQTRAKKQYQRSQLAFAALCELQGEPAHQRGILEEEVIGDGKYLFPRYGEALFQVGCDADLLADPVEQGCCAEDGTGELLGGDSCFLVGLVDYGHVVLLHSSLQSFGNAG